MKICIVCQTENDDNAVRCRVCNGLFFTNSGSNANPSPNTNNRILCSNCKRYISPSGFTCPHCGHPIEESMRDMYVSCHLQLLHSSGEQIILSDNDVLGREYNGKELFRKDPYVSRAHIRIKKVGKYFELLDISGGNSFFVNMRPVDPGGSAIVEDGDVIKIGVTDLLVKTVKD